MEDSGGEDDEDEEMEYDDEDEADSLPSGFNEGQYDEENLQTGDIFEVD